ncbi:helix-turn-helix domain-containing protein [Rhizobium sp.]|uniref:AraC family transcriptional regulator n=1 Tax=Rhizobium sp. TaxID=391 RepID=UPI002F03C878
MLQDAQTKDYFRLSASAGSLRAILCRNGIDIDCPEAPAFVLGLQHQEPALDRIVLGECIVPVIPFPYGMITLARLILDPPVETDDKETISLYLSRHSLDRIAELALTPGCAAGDTALENLLSRLTCAIAHPHETSSLLIDPIGKAFNMHIAQHYGRVPVARSAVIGGLTPWQLRRAHDTINARLDRDVSLAQLASNCGLSTSHFARAFARSTGIPPHRWLMQRRVDRAKELMRKGTPLAEIALMCGFSDQSHLTRVFSQSVGLTPGRWRESQIPAAFDMTSIALGEA